MQIQTNLISSSHSCNVKINFIWIKLYYPKNLNEPIKESQIMTGVLRKPIEHAIAKIAGIKMIEAFNKVQEKLYLSYAL